MHPSNTAEPTAVSAPQEQARATDGRSDLLRGLRAALPLLVGVIPFALLLGAQAARNGFSAIEMPLLTGLNFAGSSEFVAMRLWTSPPHILLIVAMTFLVNSRHILMGASLSRYLKHVPARKALLALFFMCDEVWAMAMADARKRMSLQVSLPYYMGLALTLYLSWVLFTTVGVIVGPLIGNVERFGFDMAFTAVFLVLLRGMWRGWQPCRPWFVSLVVAVVVYKWMPGAWYVPLGAGAGLVVAAWWGPQS